MAPSPALGDVGNRLRARFLAGLLLAVVTAGFVSGLIQLLFVPGFFPTFLMMNGALAVLAAAYAASRTRWYRWGGALAALAPMAACIAVAARNPEDRVWYAFMGIGVLIAAVFLSLRATAAVAAVAVAGIGILAALVPELRAPGRILPPLMFHFVFSPLMLLTVAHRNRLEAERRRALVEAQVALTESQRLDAVTRIATGVAHDFNNLLTVIFAGVNSLEARLPAPAEELEEVRSAAERSAALVRQLLTFAKRQVVSPRVLEVAEVVSGLQPILRRLVPAGSELVVEAPDEAGHVHLDPSQLEQVVVNLVLNARDATADGGSIRVSVGPVEVAADQGAGQGGVDEGGWVALQVSDTGAGMSEEVRRHIFEPFFTTKSPGKGTGIGLATVRSIVDQGGGRISVRTAPGQGSTFTVLFPRVAASVERPVTAATGSVLVVDDDPLVRRAMVRALVEAGLRVREAADLPSALQQCALERFALLVTDLVTTDARGPRILAALRAAAPGARILVVSAVAPPADAPLEADVQFFAKPFGGELLVQKVRETLGSSLG